MEAELKEIEIKIDELDDYGRLYLLGYIRGKITELKGFREVK